MTRRQRAYKGAATVEFAIVAPIFFFIILIPMIEFGRAMVVANAVAAAAQAGCRQGVLSSGTNSNAAVIAAVNNSIHNTLGTAATPTVNIAVNGASSNVSTAATGNTISVTVRVLYDDVSWLPISYSKFVGGRTLSSTQVMRHE